jgi:nitrate reductase delta subunit
MRTHADEMTDDSTAQDAVSRSGDGRRDFGFRKGPAHAAALDRVRTWTRERFKLGEALPVLVAEVACGLPGCPPLETVVAFWTEDDRRHQFKLFKPVAEVVIDDLPFAWLKDALVWTGEDECC